MSGVWACLAIALAATGSATAWAITRRATQQAETAAIQREAARGIQQIENHLRKEAER